MASIVRHAVAAGQPGVLPGEKVTCQAILKTPAVHNLP
jgi:hypothetical protein